jgi:hypothetical protein
MIFKILPRKYLTVWDRYNRIGKMNLSFVRGNIGSRIYVRDFHHVSYSLIVYLGSYYRYGIAHSETLSNNNI